MRALVVKASIVIKWVVEEGIRDLSHVAFAISKPPSASRLIRPAASAFRTAVSLTRSASASLRLLVARMAIGVPSQRLNLSW